MRWVAGAQTTTADGVQAILRGDYQAAVRILRPLADEDGPQPDPLAQFFMAILYDAGQCVPRNPVRACGLFLSAAKPANPDEVSAPYTAPGRLTSQRAV